MIDTPYFLEDFMDNCNYSDIGSSLFYAYLFYFVFGFQGQESPLHGLMIGFEFCFVCAPISLFMPRIE